MGGSRSGHPDPATDVRKLSRYTLPDKQQYEAETYPNVEVEVLVGY
jgi:hypothetical protein